MEREQKLLSCFKTGSGQVYDAPLFTPYLSLNKPYAALLAALGNPHEKLSPVIHVAGTNGKGSTCAFLRALAEACGKSAHVYTSPHLISYRERIRLNGSLIDQDEWLDLLSHCLSLADAERVSEFEAITATAFFAFARHPSDITILETGLGGRLDATNVIPCPAATVITRLSHDHCVLLGDSPASIAHEKAGIMRPHVPCFSTPQRSDDATQTLVKAAKERGAPLFFGQSDWRFTPTPDGFVFEDGARRFALPRPALLGDHQFENASLALAASSTFPFSVSQEQASAAMRSVFWPARLQNLTETAWGQQLSAGSQLWLDGGHNDSAGEVLSRQLALWHDERPDLPIVLICGMISTKKVGEFLSPLASLAANLVAIPIEGEHLSRPACDIIEAAKLSGFTNVSSAQSAKAALAQITTPARVLITGSLYLSGRVLDDIGIKLS